MASGRAYMASGRASMAPVLHAPWLRLGAFWPLFNPLDHRGTSSHVQDNSGAMEALQRAI
jgi:hypothetical protein